MSLRESTGPRRADLRQSASRAVLHVRKGLAVPVVLVGLGGGAAGAAYVATLHLLQRGLWPTHHGQLATLGILVAVGLAVAIIARVGGESGDVDLLVDNIHVLGGAEDVRRTRPLIPSSLLCIAAGGAMGPEAPLVQTTGTLGTWIGTRRHRSRTDVRVLTITGMAAGLTVLFGAPLGAALFALEILHRRGLQYYEALIPALVGSLCGYAVYVGDHRRRARAGLALPAGACAARRRPARRGRRRGGGGARRRAVRPGHPRDPARVRVRPRRPEAGARRSDARPARVLVAVRTHLRRGAARLRC